MKEKELKHLSKTEMLEIMLSQETELNALKDRIRELDNQVSTRMIAISEAGSIAEAALKINKVMEAAQLAADQYLDNIRAISEAQSSATPIRQGAVETKSALFVREAETL